MQELIFWVEEAPEGGFTARAEGVAIFTEAETTEHLRAAIREAVECHFAENPPQRIRLRFLREEVFVL